MKLCWVVIIGSLAWYISSLAPFCKTITDMKYISVFVADCFPEFNLADADAARRTQGRVCNVPPMKNNSTYEVGSHLLVYPIEGMVADMHGSIYSHV